MISVRRPRCREPSPSWRSFSSRNARIGGLARDAVSCDVPAYTEAPQPSERLREVRHATTAWHRGLGPGRGNRRRLLVGGSAESVSGGGGTLTEPESEPR